MTETASSAQLSQHNKETAMSDYYRCTCGNHLEKVTQSANSMLNSEQFDAARMGDWFCRRCPKNEGKNRYFWDSEVAALAAAPARIDCGEAGHEAGCCGNAKCLPSAAPAQPDDHDRELAAYRLTVENKDREIAGLREALGTAIRQNSHDMLMTGEELRECSAALAYKTPVQPDYSEFFYTLARLLDIPAQSISPERVWQEQMLPKISTALAGTAPVSKEYAELRIVRVTNNLGVADWVTVEDAKAFADATHALRMGGKP